MKNGYHAAYSNDYFDGIDDACKHDFDFVQFDLGIHTFFLNDLTKGELTDIKKYADDKGVEISLHAPGDKKNILDIGHGKAIYR